MFSGLPSTLYALLRRRDVLEAAAAAGALVAPHERRRARLVVYAVPVHATVSLFWSVLLARLLPSPAVVFAVAGGGAIAALDLGVIGRRLPAVRSLPQGPQVVDHLTFGAVVGAVVAWRRGRRRVLTGAPLRVIAARRVVGATPDKVFDFLSALENHWLLTGSFAQVVELPEQPREDAPGTVRIRGRFGLRRTVRTRLVSVAPPSRLTGEARVGSRTCASLTWRLTDRGEQTEVSLHAEIQDAGWLDQLLLALTGGWLDRNFDAVLEQLDHVVARR